MEPPKEEEVQRYFDRWIQEYEELCRMDPDAGMSERYQAAALKKILVGKNEGGSG